MSDYSNCLLEGYDIIPSAPLHVRVANVQDDFAIVSWAPPKKLDETIKGYLLYYRQLSTIRREYKHIQVVHPPYVLENLYANTEYEVNCLSPITAGTDGISFACHLFSF